MCVFIKHMYSFTLSVLNSVVSSCSSFILSLWAPPLLILVQGLQCVWLPLLPSNGWRSVCYSWSLQPSCGKSVHQHILPLSGNYVFYLGDTYRYFNIGFSAILMGHYSNKWGENCVGLVTPSVRQGPPSRHTCWDKVTFITDTFAGQKQNGSWGQR